MKQRLLAALCCLLVLAGCGQTAPVLPESTAGETVAYVPLDDRPDNVERVEYLAASLGYTLAMPEADWYQTKLDGQPLNENGTQYGDRGALLDWVLTQEEQGCDRYILSLDQLLSGGLVASRHVSGEEPVRLPDGTDLTEGTALEVLLTILAADADNQVWLLDSVMRLAPTVGYDGFGLEEYNALRAYGAAARPRAAGVLTLADVASACRLTEQGTAANPLDFGLTDAQVETYLAGRSRKLALTDETQTLLNRLGGGTFRLLIGIDDSSEENSVQSPELAYLRQQLRPEDAILSGVDDLAFKAVAGLYLAESGWSGGTASVRYYGGMEHAPACAYDYQPLTEVVAEHLAFFGLTETDASSAELQILVLTQPSEADRQTDYYEALLADLKTCRTEQRPSILIDAGNGAYGTAFHDALTRETELGWLLSYAGFLDMAIVTGTALSHGVARYAFLQTGRATQGTETAFAKTLADSVIKDFCYKNTVRDELVTFVRSELGGDPNNFWQPDIDRAAVQGRLEADMADSTAAVLDNLSRSNFISALSPYGELGWGTVTLSRYRFPWDRAFEIGMDLDVEPAAVPHRKLLGVYYR